MNIYIVEKPDGSTWALLAHDENEAKTNANTHIETEIENTSNPTHKSDCSEYYKVKQFIDGKDGKISPLSPGLYIIDIKEKRYYITSLVIQIEL